MTLGSKKYLGVSDMPRNISVRNRICALLSSTARGAAQSGATTLTRARRERTPRHIAQRRGLRVLLGAVVRRACVRER